MNKLVLKREHISNLTDNQMSQINGGDSLFCFITSKDNCIGISLCDQGCHTDSCDCGGSGGQNTRDECNSLKTSCEGVACPEEWAK